MRLLKSLLILSLFVFATNVFATHLRAGEIIYERTNGIGFQYRVHIITWTDPSGGVDDPYLTIRWGDSSQDSLPKDNETLVNPTLKRNEYIGLHTYVGVGTYEMTMEAAFRNGAVLNMDAPLSTMMAVSSVLVIGTETVPNNSVHFINPPIQNACLQEPWYHNSIAVDPDGDSLSFETRACRGEGQVVAPGYLFPNQMTPGPGNNYSIDPIDGTISWVSSQQQGEYNIAFIVKEWRNGQLVGSVVRDMQVTVGPCSNEPPEITALPDTCVEAGTFLQFPVTATDPDIPQNIALTAYGAPFLVTSSPAVFSPGVADNPANGSFSWNTNCSHVRLQPYQVVFRATDNDGQDPLEDYESMFITVVAPAPENPTATPSGLAIQLNWDPDACNNAIGYKIYRHSGSVGFVHGFCETGVPAYTGYSLIGHTNGWNSTSYLDDDGLNVGNQYCYMVVAFFPDSALSYASVEFCAILNRQVPVITHVSVGQTDVSAGIDTVRWSNAYDLDTVQFPGPYQFKLYRGNGSTGASTLIHASTLSNFLAHPDTSFLDLNMDTKTLGHVYRVELFGNNGDSLVGSSNEASSIFLTLDPNDQQITLHFTPNVPWVNTLYEVFKFDGVQWNLIGTSTTDSYVDSGLVNGETYCYYVRSTGAYSLASITAPLVNYSQEACAVPVDLTPPCPPTLTLDNDCEEPLNTLNWTNPNNSCADDTWQYHIWYTDSIGAPYVLIATITGADDTTITHVDGSSVAGCYVVTAIDSVGNESAYSNEVCGDNCPEYSLPNVFTPNSDLQNDLFVPFPYRGVKKIDLQVFNRWGQVVFRSEDPAIRWDGLQAESGEPVSEGVYYYVCTVTFARLSGDELKQLNGYVQILRSARKTD